VKRSPSEAASLVDTTLSYGALAAVCLGDRALDAEQPDLALRAFREGARQEHLYAPDAKLRLGWLLRRGNRNNEAEQQLRAAVESGDASVAPTALNLLGDLLRETGKEREAEVCYRRALEGPDFAQRAIAGWRLGDLLEERGSNAAAEAAYEASLKYDMPGAVQAALGLRQLAARSKSPQAIRAKVDAFAEKGFYAALRFGSELVEAGDGDEGDRILGLVAAAHGPASEEAASELANRLAARAKVETSESSDGSPAAPLMTT
jgi:tetratricopeptide (TPR) repeat protein